MEEDILNIEEPQIDDLQIDEPPIIEEDDTHSTIGLEDSTNTPIIPPSVSSFESPNQPASVSLVLPYDSWLR